MVSLSVYHQSVTILCLVGISLSLYAYYVETRKISDPTYQAACDIGERMSCSRVLTSRWGRGFGLFHVDSFFNIPDSLFGLIYYCLSLILNRSYTSKIIARLRVILSLMTNLGSIYLGYILYFILQDICFVCCGMYVVNFILLICNFKLLTMTTTAVASKHKQKKKQ
jgi:vitamin-K-epoxide reductase (warfarin-sensitive)